MVRFLVCAVLLSLAASSSAASLSFEQSLGALREQVLTVRVEQAKAKTAGLGARITRAANDASRLRWDAQRLRDRIRDIRWRAQRQGMGQPGQPRDPWLRNDIQRAVWDLRDLARDCGWLARDAESFNREATKDPALVGPAERLDSDAQGLQGEAQWLESDARFASWDIRRAGYNMEAWDIERESGNANTSARGLRDSARALLQKVR